MIETVGMASALALPLWNIPLIVRISRRKSSADISLAWAFGVFVCMVGMLPSGLSSGDTVFKVFSIGNCLLFAAVVVQTLRYR